MLSNEQHRRSDLRPVINLQDMFIEQANAAVGGLASDLADVVCAVNPVSPGKPEVKCTYTEWIIWTGLHVLWEVRIAFEHDLRGAPLRFGTL